MSLRVAYTPHRHDVLRRATLGVFYLWRCNAKRDRWRALAAVVRAPRNSRDYVTLGVADGRAVIALFRAGLVAVIVPNQDGRRPIGRVHVTEAGYATLRAWSDHFAPSSIVGG